SVDNARMRVERDGFTRIVDLSDSKLSWNLFRCLFDREGGLCDQKTLCSTWKDSGRQDEPENGAIHQAIHALRKTLRPLALNPKRKRLSGYMLEEVLEPPSRGSRKSPSAQGAGTKGSTRRPKSKSEGRSSPEKAKDTSHR